MIVRDTDVLRTYISVNASLEYNTLKPYLADAEIDHILEYIGAPQFAIFDVDTAPSDAIVKSAYKFAQSAICNFGVYEALPLIAAQISEAGIFQAQSEGVTSASDKQFKELQRSFKTRAHKSLDNMFKVMETNIEKFDAWKQDDTYKVFKSLLVNSTAVFNKHYNIFHSRQTFLALKAEIEIVEFQFIRSVLGEGLLKALKDDQTEAIRKEVKELVQKSIVCYTISKVAENGMFVLDATGMHVRFDVLPYEKVNAKSVKNDELVKTRLNKAIEGEQFLNLAVEKIEANISEFTEYTIPTEATVSSKIVKTPGITMI